MGQNKEMSLLPCYKKSMESEYHLLRDILLQTGVPEVYRNVLTAKENRGGMKHALTILNILAPSLQNRAVQQMGRKSADRRWKVHSTLRQPCNSGSTDTSVAAKGLPMRRRESDWQDRAWDTDTLNTLCHLPIRRLVSDATKSKSFNLEGLIEFVGRRPVADVTNVELVEALLRTVPVPVLCSELCSLHERIPNPPFLDPAASVGLLHYVTAMLASRHAFFIAGMHETRLGSGQANCEKKPCLSCIEAIITCLQDKKLLHSGLVHALSERKELVAARGGWSRYDLLLAYSSVNSHVQYVMDEQVARCGEMLNSTMSIHSERPTRRLDVSLLERMRTLINHHNIGGVPPTRAVPDVMSVLLNAEKKGMLMDFVQDIYMQDEDLGTELALIF